MRRGRVEASLIFSYLFAVNCFCPLIFQGRVAIVGVSGYVPYQ